MRRCRLLANCYTKSVSIHAPREGCDEAITDIVRSIKRFNSRTPGGVRPLRFTTVLSCLRVSIHAPREGCDLSKSVLVRVFSVVSIHAPREGCDSEMSICDDQPPRFQFTHPGRGATPRASSAFSLEKVSIHAPREGCDVEGPYSPHTAYLFQFTHPGRGATDIPFPVRFVKPSVSIHAPREGCDRRCLYYSIR